MFDLNKEIQDAFNLELSARKIVEGTISGLHKSPFHGFSTEFSERRPYNNGESTRFLDWKYFAKTEKSYIKNYEEETNLRCHIILDVSSSMYYPKIKDARIDSTKIGFASLFAASLMQIMYKQRDAIGLSMFSDQIEFYSKEKTNRKHHKTLLGALEKNLFDKKIKSQTKIYDVVSNLAERFHQRSLIIVISDFEDSEHKIESFFESLKQLSFSKHDILLFHINDFNTEIDFNFDSNIKKFIDLESGNELIVKSENIKKLYKEHALKRLEKLKTLAQQYKMEYSLLDIEQGYKKALNNYLLERRKIF